MLNKCHNSSLLMLKDIWNEYEKKKNYPQMNGGLDHSYYFDRNCIDELIKKHLNMLKNSCLWKKQKCI